MKKYLQALFITLIVICGNAQKSSGQTHKSCLVPDESRTVQDMRVTLREKSPYMDLYRSELCKIINLALEGSTDRILRNRVLNSKDTMDINWILDHTVIYDYASFSPGLFFNSYRVGGKIVFEDIHGITSDWFVFKEKDIVLVWGKTFCGNLQKKKKLTKVEVKQPVDSVVNELRVTKKVPQPASSGNTNTQQQVVTIQNNQDIVVQTTKKVPQPTSSNPCEKCTPCRDSTSISTTAKVPQQPQQPQQQRQSRRIVLGRGWLVVGFIVLTAVYYTARFIKVDMDKPTPPPSGHGTGGTGNGGNGSGGTGNGGNGSGGSGNGGNGSGGTGNHPWWKFW